MELPIREDDVDSSRETETPKAKPRGPPPMQSQHESPVQARAVSDKLDTVTQELLDLRIQNEATITEYDNLSAKYEEALQTLAAVQDAADEARHGPNHDSTASPPSTRPTSFLGDARVNELKDRGHLPSSRSLSSELSLAGDSNTSLAPSVDESPHKKNFSGDMQRGTHREDMLIRELEDLRRSSSEKDDHIATLSATCQELETLHQESMDMVEELKAEVTKARMYAAPSPTSPVIRRKSSQNVMTIDRAHRSLASLKNIAADNFRERPGYHAKL